MRRSEVLTQATCWDALQVRFVCLLSLLGLHYNLRAVLTQHLAQAIPSVCDRQITGLWQLIYIIIQVKQIKLGHLPCVVCTVHTLSVLCIVGTNCLLILDIKSKYSCKKRWQTQAPVPLPPTGFRKTVYGGHLNNFFTIARTHFSILRLLYQNSSHSEHSNNVCGLNLESFSIALRQNPLIF